MSKWLVRILIAALLAAVVVGFGTVKLGWFQGTGFSDALLSVFSSSEEHADTPGPIEVTEEEQEEFNEGLGEMLNREEGKE